jgi:microcystin-dependent protein
MAEPFVGQIITVGFTWAPEGWFPCDGRSLPIAQYDALYTLLGTTYGGDGVTTFNLPKMNGRVPLHAGQGQGLSLYIQGQALGTESVALTANNTPPHTHSLNFSKNAGTVTNPKSTATPPVPLAVGVNVLSQLTGGFYAKPAAGANTPFRPESVTISPGGQPHENRQQFTVLNYIIAWAGIFPPQG